MILAPSVDYGSSIVGGSIRYLSVSSIGKFDPSQHGGCPTRWWFHYVGGKKEPETAQQQVGTTTHNELDHWRRTGENVLGPLAMKLAAYAPPRDPRVISEQEISDEPGAWPPKAFRAVRLTAGGLPMVGKIDVLSFLGRYVDPSGEEVPDEPDTLELLDFKTTSKWQYMKTADDHRRSVQMVGYGEWARRAWPHLRKVRLSHAVAITVGAPLARKSTVLVGVEEIRDRWREQFDVVARRMIANARAASAEETEPNLSACTAFRGCPHRNYCPHAQRASLVAFLGEENMGSLLDGLNLPGGAPTTAPAAVPAPVVTQLPPPSVGVGIDMSAQLASLQANEAAQRAAIAQQPPAPVVPEYPPGFVEAVRYIDSTGRGFPTVEGKCGDLVELFRGWAPTPPGTKHNGTGTLGPLMTLSDPMLIIQLAGELQKLAAQQPPQPVAQSGIIPPDAQQPAPAAVQAQPVEMPATSAPVQTTAPATETPAATAKPKRGPGRPRKPKNAGAADAGAATEDQDPAVWLLVDCVPCSDAIEAEQLAPLIDVWVETVRAGAEKRNPGNVPDIRVAPDDNPLAFGKWRGVFAAIVRHGQAQMTPGFWIVDTRGSDFADLAIEALRPYLASTGGGIIRGLK